MTGDTLMRFLEAVAQPPCIAFAWYWAFRRLMSAKAAFYMTGSWL